MGHGWKLYELLAKTEKEDMPLFERVLKKQFSNPLPVLSIAHLPIVDISQPRNYISWRKILTDKDENQRFRTVPCFTFAHKDQVLADYYNCFWLNELNRLGCPVFYERHYYAEKNGSGSKRTAYLALPCEAIVQVQGDETGREVQLDEDEKAKVRFCHDFKGCAIFCAWLLRKELATESDIRQTFGETYLNNALALLNDAKFSSQFVATLGIAAFRIAGRLRRQAEAVKDNPLQLRELREEWKQKEDFYQSATITKNRELPPEVCTAIREDLQPDEWEKPLVEKYINERDKVRIPMDMSVVYNSAIYYSKEVLPNLKTKIER